MNKTLKITDTCDIDIDDHGRIDIYISGEWACSGTWNGQRLDDAEAPLGEDLYEAIESALTKAGM